MKKLLLILSLLLTSNGWGQDKISNLENISVSVVSGTVHGSGVLKTRKIGNDNVTFVWTAGHLIESRATHPEINIIQHTTLDHDILSSRQAAVDIVAHSPEKEEDLLLLRVKQKNFTTASVEFYLDKKSIPPISEVWNVNCHNKENSCFYSKGILANTSYSYKDKKYDYFNCNTIEGSSGSGMFSKEGKMIGMVVRSNKIFTLATPTRRIVAWAKKNNVEWAVDDKVAMPSMEKLEELCK